MSDNRCRYVRGRMEADARCVAICPGARGVPAGWIRGFTLIELLVVIAIISLLVSILIPTLNHAKFLAKNAVCLSNQHQIAIASITYAADFCDIIALASEATWINSVHGDRETPRILADAKLLPISDRRGGVWRCPLDDRDYEPLFLAGYYYSRWGPGDPSDLPAGSGWCSYTTNQLWRATSPRSTWSYTNMLGCGIAVLSRAGCVVDCGAEEETQDSRTILCAGPYSWINCR